jgi:hypothetical protein
MFVWVNSRPSKNDYLGAQFFEYSKELNRCEYSSILEELNNQTHLLLIYG